MATNSPFAEWDKIFADPRLCADIADRITFRCTLIQTGTDSYRYQATEADRRAAESTGSANMQTTAPNRIFERDRGRRPRTTGRLGRPVLAGPLRDHAGQPQVTESHEHEVNGGFPMGFLVRRSKFSIT